MYDYPTILFRIHIARTYTLCLVSLLPAWPHIALYKSCLSLLATAADWHHGSFDRNLHLSRRIHTKMFRLASRGHHQNFIWAAF